MQFRSCDLSYYLNDHPEIFTQNYCLYRSNLQGPPSSDKMLIVPMNPVLQLHKWFSHLSLDI